MQICLGGLGLLGTIGCCTVEVAGDSAGAVSRCVGFVRAPAQLSGAVDQGARAEVVCTVVRAPFAGTSGLDAGNRGADQQQFAASQLPVPCGGVVNSNEAIVAMVERAVQRSVVLDKLPLARFELVISVISSCEAADLQCIAAAACGALVDSAIPLRDVFGAASAPLAGGRVSAIVAAHSCGVLGMQSTAVHCAPEQLCAAVEQCARTAAKGTLAAFGAAATRCAEVLQRQQQQQQAVNTAVLRN